MGNPYYTKKNSQTSEHKRIDFVTEELKQYFLRGFKLFNIYHFRKSDELCIQLKNGKGESKTLKYKATYPVYRFPTGQLKHEENIFKSLYFIRNNRCTQHYVTSDTINKIGKLGTNDDLIDKTFNPERYLVYNVLRPEYYVSTTLKQEEQLTFEETRIGSLDIEIIMEGGKFPAPNKAEYPIGLLTVFDFNNLAANVFYLKNASIEDDVDKIWEKIKEHMPDQQINFSINLFAFDDEKTLIEDLIVFLNKNFDLIVGWNVNEFDFAYICNRAKNKFKLKLDFNIVYDGFAQSYVFEHFVVIDYMSIYKFFVKKNPPSLKLADIASSVIGISKIQSETFLDTAYNITDTLLPYLMDQKLNLINQMFSFKENGAVLHVFNVRNALEPLIIKKGAVYEGSFIANQYTIYYNIYYNEVYKYINRDMFKLDKTDCHIFETRNLEVFLTQLSRHEELLNFYMSSDKEEEKKDDSKEDSAGVVLSKMVEKVFKKKRVKKKVENQEPEPEININELACKKNFDYSSEEFDDILVKLYGINIDTIYGYPGAFNKSFRGVSGDIIDLDFFSMYPVIIYGLNISIETGKYLAPFKLNILKVYDRDLYEKYVNEQPNSEVVLYDLRIDRFCKLTVDQLDSTVYTTDSIIANSGMIFNKQIGFIPNMCAYFLEVRTKYKELMNKEEDPVTRGKYNIYQLLYKVYNNSIYGYLGYKYSVLFNRLLVASVTIMGRSEILFANYKINSYLGGTNEQRIGISTE